MSGFYHETQSCVAYLPQVNAGAHQDQLHKASALEIDTVPDAHSVQKDSGLSWKAVSLELTPFRTPEWAR